MVQELPSLNAALNACAEEMPWRDFASFSWRARLSHNSHKLFQRPKSQPTLETFQTYQDADCRRETAVFRMLLKRVHPSTLDEMKFCHTMIWFHYSQYTRYCCNIYLDIVYYFPIPILYMQDCPSNIENCSETAAICKRNFQLQNDCNLFSCENLGDYGRPSRFICTDTSPIYFSLYFLNGWIRSQDGRGGSWSCFITTPHLDFDWCQLDCCIA